MKKFLPVITYTLAGVFLILLIGCGLTKAQRDGISTFGQATAILGTASKEQFQGGRENVILMNRQRLAIERETLPAKQPDGSPANREFYAKEMNLDSELRPASIQLRVDSVDLLIQYGNLLTAFSSETQEKELTAAASNFTDSIKDFPNNPLSPDEINGLGQIVIITGKMWVEGEKKEALKKIIPTVSPLVTKICDLLQRDFDLKSSGVAAAINNAQDRLANEAIDGLKRKGDSISDRLVLINGFSFADQNKEALQNISAQISKSVESMRKANKELTNLIQDDKFSINEIKAFSNDAKALAKAIKPFME